MLCPCRSGRSPMSNNRVQAAPLFIDIALVSGTTLVILGLVVTIGWFWRIPAVAQLLLGMAAVILIALATALIYLRVRPLVRALRVSEQRLQLALQVSDSHVWDF